MRKATRAPASLGLPNHEGGEFWSDRGFRVTEQGEVALDPVLSADPLERADQIDALARQEV